MRNAAIGFGGILISGRMPIGGGSKLCGRGDLRASELLAVGWAGPGGGGGGGIDRLPPFEGSTRPVGGGGGGGAGGPVGNTWNGIPMAAAPSVAAGETELVLPLLLLVPLLL